MQVEIDRDDSVTMDISVDGMCVEMNNWKSGFEGFTTLYKYCVCVVCQVATLHNASHLYLIYGVLSS